MCIYLFHTELRTNSDYFTIRHYLIDFHSREAVCLLRGRNRSLYKLQVNPSLSKVKQKRVKISNSIATMCTPSGSRLLTDGQ